MVDQFGDQIAYALSLVDKIDLVMAGSYKLKF